MRAYGHTDEKASVEGRRHGDKAYHASRGTEDCEPVHMAGREDEEPVRERGLSEPIDRLEYELCFLVLSRTGGRDIWVSEPRKTRNELVGIAELDNLRSRDIEGNAPIILVAYVGIVGRSRGARGDTEGRVCATADSGTSLSVV